MCTPLGIEHTIDEACLQSCLVVCASLLAIDPSLRMSVFQHMDPRKCDKRYDYRKGTNWICDYKFYLVYLSHCANIPQDSSLPFVASLWKIRPFNHNP